MTQGSKIKTRCAQVLKWLKRSWPPPDNMAIRLRVVEELPECHGAALGVCVWNEAGDAMLWIKKSTTSESIGTLLHEYSHIITEGRGECDGHGDEFYIALGAVERGFHYFGGKELSMTL